MANAKARKVEDPTSVNTTTSPAKRAYVRQGDIPRLTFEEVLKLPRAIQDNFAGKPTAPHRVAMALDMSFKSSGWEDLCGASIGYGLTDGGARASEIALTDLGRAIVAPIREDQEADAMVQAVLKPATPQRFFTQYNRNKFPPDRIAKNVIAEMGVPAERVDRVLEVIKANGEFVGIIQQGKTGPIVDIEGPGLRTEPSASDDWRDMDDGAEITGTAVRAPVDIGTFIYSDPTFRGGRPCIAGTGLSVHAIASRYREGQSAEDIAADIPDVPLSHIHAALAYYLANREELDAEYDAEAAEYDRLYDQWTRERRGA